MPQAMRQLAARLVGAKELSLRTQVRGARMRNSKAIK
jgi:hypothetical protein